jgi:hypothetical protein
MKRGTFVLVRTYSAGVHFGTLEEFEGQYVKLSNARRLWSWSGALSLSEVAMNGIKINDSKISVCVDEIILTQAIELIRVSEKSNLPGNEITHKNISIKA